MNIEALGDLDIAAARVLMLVDECGSGKNIISASGIQRDAAYRRLRALAALDLIRATNPGEKEKIFALTDTGRERVEKLTVR